MSTAHKIIKYFALAFAVAIIFGIVQLIYQIGNAIFSEDELLSELKVYEFNNQFEELDLDINAARLAIKVGNFRVETNSEKIKVVNEGKKLVVKDKSTNWFHISSKISDVIVTLYIPEELLLDKVEIETGAGKVEIDKLSANKLNIDLGAGETIINKVVVNKDFKLNTGAGGFTIKDGVINNFDCDLGVGKTNITGVLLGESEIDSGVGELNIKILDYADNYSFEVSKGVGTINYNGISVKDGSVLGNGSNHVSISGGVGEINIKTKQ